MEKKKNSIYLKFDTLTHPSLTHTHMNKAYNHDVKTKTKTKKQTNKQTNKQNPNTNSNTYSSTDSSKHGFQLPNLFDPMTRTTLSLFWLKLNSGGTMVWKLISR